MIYLKKILDFCSEHKMAESAFEKGAGLSKGQINSWKNGSKPRLSSLEKAASFMGMTVDELLQEDPGEERGPAVTVSIPLAGTNDRIQVLANDISGYSDCFALRIADGSMLPGFDKGDIVIAAPVSEYSSGDVVTISTPGRPVYCRKLVYMDGGLLLQPYNRKYDAEYYTERECESLPLFITGKVIRLMRSCD